MAYVALLLVYGTFFPSSIAHTLASNPFSAKDTLALLIIVYSAKRQHGGLTCASGMPRLLNKILQDATMYFLVLFTGHFLLLFCELFAPVGDPVNLWSTAYDRPYIDPDQIPSWGVSCRPRYCNECESDGTRSAHSVVVV